MIDYFTERTADGETVSGIARSFDVHRSAIQGVLAGRTWAHVAYRPKVADAMRRHPSAMGETA
jgi:hypothetical protein